MSLHYQPNFDDLPNSAFIRLNQIIGTRVAPFSASTVWRKVRSGQFPAPTKLSDNITAWSVGAIRQWQKSLNSLGSPQNDYAGDA
jgi:prophage regulatory protein